jgi:tetratricopeptide (TPR) repeat protein
MASPIAFLLQLVISEYMKARMKKINMKTVFSIFTLSLMIAIVVAKFLHLPGYPFHQYALDAASDIFSKNIQSKFEMKEDYVIGINHDEDSYIHIEEDNRCGDIKILVSRENYPKLHEFKAYRKYKIYYYPHTRICVKYEESDFNRACDLIENENYYKAIVLLDQEIKNNPKRPYAYIAKAYALVNLEKYTEAIKNCNKAIKINSEISEAYLYKCFSLIELKKYEEAQQCVGKILELDPFHEYGEYVICEISAEHIENINNRIEEGINSSLHKISDNLSIQSSNSANEESEKDQILSINEEQVRKNIEKIDKVIETKRYEGNNYFIKGNLLYSIEDYENAYDAYNFATIHLDKSDFYYAQAHYNKSLCAALLNRPAYATGALKIAIEADKKYKELAEKEKIFDNVRDSTCFKWLWDQLE